MAKISNAVSYTHLDVYKRQMTYLPVTKEELKEWAVYDEQSNMFIWER